MIILSHEDNFDCAINTTSTLIGDNGGNNCTTAAGEYLYVEHNDDGVLVVTQSLKYW